MVIIFGCIFFKRFFLSHKDDVKYKNVVPDVIKANCTDVDSNGYMVSYLKISKFFIPFCDKVKLTKCKFRILLGNLDIDPDNGRHNNVLLYDLFIGALNDNGEWDHLTPFVRR